MNATAPPSGQRGSVLVPPPPTGSILQKQSSFTRTKPTTPSTTATPSTAASNATTKPSAMTASPQPVARSTAPMESAAHHTASPRPTAGAATALQTASPSTATRTTTPAANAAAATKPTATSPALAGPNRAAPPPGMWGPDGSMMYKSASGLTPGSAQKVAPISTNSVYGTGQGTMTNMPSALGRSGSFNQGGGGSMYGSMRNAPTGSFGPTAGPMTPGSMMMGGAGPMGSAYGSMTNGPYGSLGPNQFGSMRSVNQYGSIGGTMANANSFQQPPFASNGSMAGGSMYGMQPNSQYGSMYGMQPRSMGGGSLYGPAAMTGGSMYGMQPGPMGSMYRPMGSMYGPMGGGMTSAYGFAAQWGSLANINGDSMMGAENGLRSTTGSAYGGFQMAKAISLEDICPVIDSWEDAPEVKRSGRRGGNKLYSQDKNDKTVIRTSNLQSAAMTIKHKKLVPSDEDGGAGLGSLRVGRSASATAGDRPRAKVPTNYDVHTLIVVDKGTSASRACVTVLDPNTVKFEKDDKRERYECDEALERDAGSGELDSVLLSELRGNWLSGHNSSLLVMAGEDKSRAAVEVVKAFVRKSITRIASETTAKGGFDVAVNVAALRGSDLCADLLKDSDYTKIKLGSSPVYGPCILDLKTRRARSAKECIEALEDGLAAKKASGAEVVVAFLVLKHYKQGATEMEVHLSSLCIGFFQQNGSLLIDIKEKASSSPHRLFRYAVGGASLTVSMLCVADTDAKARSGLEVERKMRVVKNTPPRSGNVKRFIEFTEKEIARQREKLDGASGSERATREAQVKRMEEMVKDAKEVYKNPESKQPKGYSV